MLSLEYSSQANLFCCIFCLFACSILLRSTNLFVLFCVPSEQAVRALVLESSSICKLIENSLKRAHAMLIYLSNYNIHQSKQHGPQCLISESASKLSLARRTFNVACEGIQRRNRILAQGEITANWLENNYQSRERFPIGSRWQLNTVHTECKGVASKIPNRLGLINEQVQGVHTTRHHWSVTQFMAIAPSPYFP